MGVAHHPDRLRVVFHCHRHHGWLERSLRDPVRRHPVLVTAVLHGQGVEAVGEVLKDGFLRGVIHALLAYEWVDVGPVKYKETAMSARLAATVLLALPAYAPGGLSGQDPAVAAYLDRYREV